MIWPFTSFRRKPPLRPATMQVHTDADITPAWREPPERWPSQPDLSYYAPKLREPEPLPPETGFVISLSRERQLRLSRILRHGYQLGVVAAPANVVPWRRAA
jgi:hypothetical protein